MVNTQEQSTVVPNPNPTTSVPEKPVSAPVPIKPLPSLYERKYNPYAARFSPLGSPLLSVTKPVGAQTPVDEKNSNAGPDRTKSAAKPTNKCANCGTTSTPLWRRGPKGEVICNACGLYLKARNTYRPSWLKQRRVKKEGEGAQPALPIEPVSAPAQPIVANVARAIMQMPVTVPQNPLPTPPYDKNAPFNANSTQIQYPHQYIIPASPSSVSPQQEPQQQQQRQQPQAAIVPKEEEPVQSIPSVAAPSPSVSRLLGDPPGSARANMQCINCSTTSTPLWRRDDKGNPICNACGLYYKLHGSHRPVTLKRAVIKRRKRVPPTTNVAVGPYETGAWAAANEKRELAKKPALEPMAGALTLPPLKSIIQMDNFTARSSIPSIHIPASEDTANKETNNVGGYRLLPNPFTAQPSAAGLTNDAIKQTRAELVSEIDRLRSLLTHKAGILEGLEKAERMIEPNQGQGARPFGQLAQNGSSIETNTIRLPSIREGFDDGMFKLQREGGLRSAEALDDAEVSATQALMSLASGGNFV